MNNHQFDNHEEILYSIADVTNILGVTRVNVHRYIKEGQLKTKKVEVYPKISSLPDEVIAITHQALKDFLTYRQELLDDFNKHKKGKIKKDIGLHLLPSLDDRDSRTAV